MLLLLRFVYNHIINTIIMHSDSLTPRKIGAIIARRTAALATSLAASANMVGDMAAPGDWATAGHVRGVASGVVFPTARRRRRQRSAPAPTVAAAAAARAIECCSRRCAREIQISDCHRSYPISYVSDWPVT